MSRYCVKIDHDRVWLVCSSGLTGSTADAEQIADHLAVGAIFFARCFSLLPGRYRMSVSAVNSNVK
ncbi:hypothetical protein [Alicyclobacillus acidoterrestris]|uniref:Uncharacterized protein n=1 Tax=Alicyclobacillus acidoterrestris (strain ATCC 49025 / DSM 3922 / CIP 106132 / NCIMB 13137 / GD3B) TaxID=1356854 RepID=T0DQ85_ALIAG|nr:hypothetical protein [Alicyclobacillus acidoterrestris]EPZ51651.1 hypothetical protein N007_20680 [Alicyclobacillus acidoterrestris ATCC 49025]UNO49618.1 hypothetical protein K1I37_03490 [Alicyclobacillus acidoterrestris]